ncbi:MAG TPA: immunoglobulin domain-containing protein, partial [Phycisphaerae bacterium]|nr:immunoglobulin domain-containing protein [Phycisphaerae bacterium]
ALNANIKDTSGNAHVIQASSMIFDTNNFQHVALTYNKSSGIALLYLNGSVVASNNFGNITPQTTYPLNIGRRTGQPIGNGSNYGGLIDELSLYNRALTNSEIQAIYNAGGAGKCPIPPTILVQPTNQTVAVGGSTTFGVIANGSSPFLYQWSFNGTNLVNATNTSLTLTNVQFTQAGAYSVLVANAAGSITSSNAILTVLAPPIILTQPTNVTVIRSSNATFNVTAAGSLPLSYQWNFGGTNITGATNTALTLTNVQLNQSGNYAVLVTNAYGSILSSNATLVVNPLFHFIWNPIPSPRFVNVPFAVVIQAQNPTNGVATNFTDTVVLLSTNGIAVNPAVSGNFVQGVWTGAVAIAQTKTNLVLQAQDSFGESGLANPINVIHLPALSTIPSGGTLYIVWPVSPSGFILETTPGLSPASWTQVSEPPIQIGDQYLEPISVSGTNAFYRLRFTGP